MYQAASAHEDIFLWRDREPPYEFLDLSHEELTEGSDSDRQVALNQLAQFLFGTPEGLSLEKLKDLHPVSATQQPQPHRWINPKEPEDTRAIVQVIFRGEDEFGSELFERLGYPSDALQALLRKHGGDLPLMGADQLLTKNSRTHRH